MKAEKSETNPKFDLMNPDGVRPQVNSQVITQVLLNDGSWYGVVPGSFKFYKTSDSVPFVQFDTASDGVDGVTRSLRIEVFPATVAGWAYPTPQTEADGSDDGAAVTE